MVGHQAVGEEADRVPFMGFLHGPLERGKVALPAEHHHSTDRAIHHVVDQTAGSDARGARHGEKGKFRSTPCQITSCVPVSLPLRMCELGQKLKTRRLSRAKARKMIPSLQRQLRRFASQPLEFEAAETLRLRVMEKDWDKLFTFLRVKDVEPTSNHAERSLRFMVIMRKICFGTRSPEGSESHSVPRLQLRRS